MSRVLFALTNRRRKRPPRGGGVRLAIARLHVLAQRYRIVPLGVALALATVAAVSVASANERADSLAASFGTTQRWPVALHDLAAGHQVGVADIEWRDVPVRFTPAATAPASLVGASLLVPVGSGEIITIQRLTTVQGLSALVPPNHRGVAIPTDDVRLELHLGDRVDLIASSTYSEYAELPGGLATSGALVLSVSDDAIVLAVPSRDAVVTAEAIERGGAAVVLSGVGDAD